MDKIDKEESKKLIRDITTIAKDVLFALIDGKVSEQEGERLLANLKQFGEDFGAAVKKQDGDDE